MRLAADLVVGNLNEDGYLTATDEELVDGFLQARGPARVEPIPFERGMKPRPPWESQAAGLEAGQNSAAGAAEDIVGERAAALAIITEAREIIHHLDPLGVGARDLRECLLIQISAQRREAELVLNAAKP